jgi:hypothetical protein
MNIQASTPASTKWISPLCNTSWSTRENTVPRHISCISGAFQFHHLSNNVSLPFYDETKLQYSNSQWTHRKLDALCISSTMQLFVCHFRKGLQMQWKGLTLKQGTKNFPCNLPWTSVLSLFCPLVKGSNIWSDLKGVTNMWKLPAENQWFYCFQLFYGTREWENVKRYK